MSIIYPFSQAASTTSGYTPYAIEIITTASLPITITGSTTPQHLLTFFFPPGILYKVPENQSFYLGLICYCTGNIADLTASVSFEAPSQGGGFNTISASFTPNDVFNNGASSLTYTRFKSPDGNYVNPQLDSTEQNSTGFSFPLYISASSNFTASIYKMLLSPT